MTPRILDTVFAAGAVVPEDSLPATAVATVAGPHAPAVSIRNPIPKTSLGLPLVGLGAEAPWLPGSAPTAAPSQSERKGRGPFWVLLLSALALGLVLQALALGPCWTAGGGRRTTADSREPAAVAPTAGVAHPSRGIGPLAQAAPARYRWKNIEDIRVGDRVWAHNPEVSEAERQVPDPDPASWRRLSLVHFKQDGRRVDVELLRPEEWLHAEKATQGGRLWLDLPEMGCEGWATVLAVGPCPPLAPGRGRVVTGTYVHEGATNVLDLRVEGLERLIGVTSNHPVYSRDRSKFVPAGDLQPGEQVQLASGGPRRVVNSASRPGRYPVYNFEVQVEHAYHVSALGLLVHNTTPPQPSPRPSGLVDGSGRPLDGSGRPIDPPGPKPQLVDGSGRPLDGSGRPINPPPGPKPQLLDGQGTPTNPPSGPRPLNPGPLSQEQVDSIVNAFTNRFGKPPAGIYVVGSHAEGSAKPSSDIDIVIETDIPLDKSHGAGFEFFKDINPGMIPPGMTGLGIGPTEGMIGGTGPGTVPKPGLIDPFFRPPGNVTPPSIQVK